jgi:hypothetical protein
MTSIMRPISTTTSVWRKRSTRRPRHIAIAAVATNGPTLRPLFYLYEEPAFYWLTDTSNFLHRAVTASYSRPPDTVPDRRLGPTTRVPHELPDTSSWVTKVVFAAVYALLSLRCCVMSSRFRSA